MTHRRFFVGVPRPGDVLVALSPGDSRHVVSVLRLDRGDRVYLFDGTGREYAAVIESATPSEVRCRIVGTKEHRSDAATELVLILGVPKHPRMDLVVEKCTEIGVREFVPVITERCVGRPGRESGARRVDGWRAIARAASAQCGRSTVPVVWDVTTLASAASQARARNAASTWVVPWECEERSSFGEVLADARSRSLVAGMPPSVTCVIGPEGGLSAAEVDGLRGHGAVTVTMGPRILRAETAAIVASAIILHEMGDLG